MLPRRARHPGEGGLDVYHHTWKEVVVSWVRFW
jgi:hypothetical protein